MTSVSRGVLLFAFAVLAAGCAVSTVPSGLVDVPWTEPTFDGTVHRARLQIDQGDERVALEALDALLVREPRNVDAHRVRQDILRGRGRMSLVLREAEERLAKWGEDDPSARYLFGRLQPTDARKQAEFTKVLEIDPRSFWGWFGMAFTYRQESAPTAVVVYESLYERSGKNGLVALALGETLRLAGQHDRALEVYGEQRESPSMIGIADRCVAETLIAAGRQQEAWPPLLEAMRLRPSDPGIRRVLHRMLAQGLARQYVEQVLDVLFEDPDRLDRFRANDAGAALVAELFERVGNLPAARATLARAPGSRGTTSAATLRHRREQRLAIGDVAGYLAALKGATPEFVVRDERNRVRGVWVRLLDGPWMDHADPIADPKVALGLCEALRDAGRLRAADLVGTLALARDPGDEETFASIRDVRDEARRQSSFEGALRRLLYAGYRVGDDEDESPLEEVLDKLRQISRRILGSDVVGDPDVYAIPLVGQLVDPFGSELAAHLDKYNRHLVLGQRWAGTVEGMLFGRLSLRQLEISQDLPLTGRCFEVVGDDRRIRALGSVLGGDVAGVALLDHYIIDFDAVRDWAAGILSRRRIARDEDRDVVLEDPLPTSGDPMDPLDQQWRMSLVSPVADEDLEAAVFDMICAHERQHLVDALYYLPPLTNPWRTLKLVFGHGFSPLAIESTMEGRAEAGALLASPHTHLVLAHIVGFLRSHSAESPHAIGFRRFAEYVRGRLLDDPAWKDHAAVRSWHRVPPERMRAIARDFLDVAETPASPNR